MNAPAALPLAARLPWIAMGTRLAIAGAAILLVFAAVFPAAFNHEGRVFLAFAYIAFMIRTFWFHIGIGLLPFAVTAFTLKLRRWGMLSLVLLGWTLIPAAWSFRPRASPPSGTPALTVMSMNLLLTNGNINAMLDSIGKENPDVILFQEYTPAAAASIGPALHEKYPHSVNFGRDDAFGQAVFSRLPFIGTPEPYPQRTGEHAAAVPVGFVGSNDPQIRVVVEVGGSQVVIQNVHVSPPVSLEYFKDQRSMLAWLAKWGASEQRPLIMGGDFNATQQSAELGKLRAAGLTSALDEAGWGRCSTWPQESPLSIFPGVRIDQLMSRGLICESAKVAAPTGSDHLPIVARFSLPAR